MLPFIVTTLPKAVLGKVTVKLLVLVAELLGVVSEIRPVVAPLGTVTVSSVAELTVNTGAFTPLMATEVVPVRLVPVTVTTVPTGPLTGVKPMMVDTEVLGPGGPPVVPPLPGPPGVPVPPPPLPPGGPPVLPPPGSWAAAARANETSQSESNSRRTKSSECFMKISV
ncbi:hypothetical protein GCM10023185_29610 [Hymenobacter saemangeumensis]|uniref:Uncharacterized protein n=1 Tax=Hymenobacter saemangeumensis TaxID=1084522 RepID=A0ABP8IL16_9BACT